MRWAPQPTCTAHPLRVCGHGRGVASQCVYSASRLVAARGAAAAQPAWHYAHLEASSPASKRIKLRLCCKCGRVRVLPRWVDPTTHGLEPGAFECRVRRKSRPPPRFVCCTRVCARVCAVGKVTLLRQAAIHRCVQAHALSHTHSTQHTAAGPLSYSRRSRRIAVEHECDASEHERECATRNAHSVRSRNPAAARRMQPAASACRVATGAPCHPGLAPDVGHAAVVVLHGRFYRAGVVSGIGSVASSGIGVAATVIGCPECGGGSPSECAQRVLQGRETDRCDG